MEVNEQGGKLCSLKTLDSVKKEDRTYVSGTKACGDLSKTVKVFKKTKKIQDVLLNET